MKKWVVVYTSKRFDIPLYESESKPAAKIYLHKLRPLSKSVKIKQTKKVRLLKEVYIEEDILHKVSIG